MNVDRLKLFARLSWFSLLSALCCLVSLISGLATRGPTVFDLWLAPLFLANCVFVCLYWRKATSA